MCLECLLFMYLNVFIVAFVQAKISGDARNLFLPGHYNLCLCGTETAQGMRSANPAFFSSPRFRFKSLSPNQHAFFVGCADSDSLAL